MKGKYVIIISIFLLVTFTIFFCFFKKEKNNEEKKIDNIKYFSFSYSDGYEVDSNVYYSIDCKDKCVATVKPLYVSHEDEKEYIVDNEFIDKVIELLNKYEVIKWNGFDKSDINVLDGDSFSFSIITNENEEIKAHGYMLWPKNYGNVKSGLDSLFSSLK